MVLVVILLNVLVYSGFTPQRNAESIPLMNYWCLVIACWDNPTVIFLPDILNQLLSYCNFILEQSVQVLANRLMFWMTEKLLGILSFKTTLFTADKNKSSAFLVLGTFYEFNPLPVRKNYYIDHLTMFFRVSKCFLIVVRQDICAKTLRVL